MPNPVRMKFSGRLILIFGILISCALFFAIWKQSVIKDDSLNKFGNDGQWPEFRPLKNSTSEAKNQKWESIFDSSKRVVALTNTSVCDFAKKGRFHADIDTQKLLHVIDDVYKDHWDKSGSQDFNEYFDLPSIMNVDMKSELQDKTLHIIAVPHSHIDPGWLKTLDRYYTEQTKNILTFMVKKLIQYPNMTFVWSETVLLEKWWNEIDHDTHIKVQNLVRSNRLEIVNGGWIVPDEATTHYFGIIDQMIEGHQWLEDHLGVKPKNSWSLDVFGYSPSLAYLLRRAGYDHMVILRINKYLKDYLQGKRLLEFAWRQQWDRNNLTDIFTTVLPYKLYSVKHQCGPDESVCRFFDFRNIPGEYAEAAPVDITVQHIAVYARQLLEQYVMKNKLYSHNVVMVPIGDDFRFDREIEWDQQYLNYAKLFDYMNQNYNVHARFGTLQDYYNAVEQEMQNSPDVHLPVLEGDFFPYTDRDQEYWTGFYTTRPYDKCMGRELETNLRAAEILNVLAYFTNIKLGKYNRRFESNIEKLKYARQNLGLFQHHDAITGTARAHVVIDYEHRLLDSFETVKHVIQDASLYLLTRNDDTDSHVKIERERPKTMYMLNSTKLVLDFTTMKKHRVVLFNPLAQDREDIIRVTVNQATVDVYDNNGHVVLSQLNPVWKTQNEISDKEFVVIFLVKIPALGMVTYSIVALDGDKPKENVASFISVSNFKQHVSIPKSSRFVSVAPRGETYVLENEYLRARFSARSGYIKSVTTKAKLGTNQVHAELLTYKSRASGAYIFKPTGPAVDTEMYNLPPIKVMKGPIVSEIQLMQRDDVCEHTVRVYNSTGLLGTALEINNIANMEFKEDKELVLRFKTDIQPTNGTFYTDLNGLQTARRIPFKNFPKEANFYPMTTHAFFEDESTRLSILSAQSLGVSSQELGSLEVMLERNPLYNDGRGLGEGIRDNKRTLSQFFMLIERRDSKAQQTRRLGDTNPETIFPSLQAHLLQRQIQYPAIILHLKNDSDNILHSFSPVSNMLPCDTHLVNFRSMMSKVGDSAQKSVASPVLLLHRLGYQCDFPLLGVKCDTSHSDIVLNKFLKDITFDRVHEKTLSLLYNIREWDPNQALRLSPMELYAYKVTPAVK